MRHHVGSGLITRGEGADPVALTTGVPAAWLDWYRAHHSERFATLTGGEFEAYVTDALRLRHGPTFINPQPKGTLGDYGCDGITGDGRTAYAAFGYLPNRATEAGLVGKINSDFARALAKWDTFDRWCFVTNVGIGPKAAQAFVAINRTHDSASARPIKAYPMDKKLFWSDVLKDLDESHLRSILPGVPNAMSIALGEMLPLLDVLSGSVLNGDQGARISPVSPTKMDYNELPERVRLEFNDARIHMPAIDRWFAEHRVPGLRDAQANRFRQIYEEARASSKSPNELVERLYVALGGENFRFEESRANAVYAVTVYFFDECDIFETPPEGWEPSP